MTREEARRRVAKGFGWWETEWYVETENVPLPYRDFTMTRDVYCARLKDGTTMRVRWP